MGKLKFKGDKKRLKNNKPIGRGSENGGAYTKKDTINAAEDKQLDSDSIRGWTTAICEGDLKGPCIILPRRSEGAAEEEEEKEEVKCLLVANGSMGVSANLEISLDAINFFKKEVSCKVHRCEPTKVNQVLTFIPLNQFERSRLDDRGADLFALKAYNNLFLSATGPLAHAIGKHEIFTATSSLAYNSKDDFEEVLWSIRNDDHVLVCENFSTDACSLKFVNENDTADESLISKFVIRVQCKNTIEGSRILLNRGKELHLDEESQIGFYVRLLYKETKGRVSVDEHLIERLKEALQKGKINEQLVEEKAKISSRW